VANRGCNASNAAATTAALAVTAKCLRSHAMRRSAPMVAVTPQAIANPGPRTMRCVAKEGKAVKSAARLSSASTASAPARQPLAPTAAATGTSAAPGSMMTPVAPPARLVASAPLAKSAFRGRAMRGALPPLARAVATATAVTWLARAIAALAEPTAWPASAVRATLDVIRVAATIRTPATRGLVPLAAVWAASVSSAAT
jgi:hypothetical protein